MIRRKQKVFARRSSAAAPTSRRLFNTSDGAQTAAEQQAVGGAIKKEHDAKQHEAAQAVRASRRLLVFDMQAQQIPSPQRYFFFSSVLKCCEASQPPGLLSLQPPGMQESLNHLCWIGPSLPQSVTHRQLASSRWGHGGQALRVQTAEKSTLAACDLLVVF